MPSSVSPLSGPTTRTYTIVHEARTHTVQLFHNTITGERALSVDGAEVPGSAGSTTFFSPKKTLVFNIDGATGELTLHFTGSSVDYVCTFKGAEVAEENTMVGGSDASAAAADTVNRLKITVDAGDSGVDEGGKPVVWFRLRTVRESDEREVVVHRRFNQFFAVNEALRSAYKGSHLLASFPDLPPRALAGSMLTSLFGRADALDPGFVEARRWKLQDYLYKVSQVPRMRSNPDFLTFLGVIDNTRECSVLFPPDVALGLTLKAAGEFVEVAALKPLPDGRPSPAQMSGLAHVGDKISKVNGEDVLGASYEVIVAKLKTAPRPLMIHFLGLFPDRPAHEGAGELRGAGGGGGAGAMSSVPMAEAPAAARASSDAPAAAEPGAATGEADSRAIGGLIGGGISYVGTGATPRPGAAPRTGLAHHAAAAEAPAEERSPFDDGTAALGVL